MRDYRQSTLVPSMRIYYYCDHIAHMKANSPLLATKPVQAPALATLRIIDRVQGRAEPTSARGRAFQLMAEEARTAPDVVAGMFSIPYLIDYFYCMLMCLHLC